MSNSLPHGIILRHERETAVTPLHLLILLSLSLGAIAWGEALILGGEGLQFQSYLALLGLLRRCLRCICCVQDSKRQAECV